MPWTVVRDQARAVYPRGDEPVPNHYYRHNEDGVRYIHYYDGRRHWYGFCNGPTFYWTRYYSKPVVFAEDS
ncbi:MAG: hypothetical protein KGL74_12385, partial [Elusimicrobia bacterium]|nr:hypothetical protein [Elusimicrobiota bacterium]